VPYPGTGQTSGVIVSAVIMVALSVGLYALFRRNGWL
jgi:LPXTG-motif cell wall-anchored protein